MKWNTIKYDIRDKNSYRNLVFWIQTSITESVCKTFAFRIPDISLIFCLREIKLLRVVRFSEISHAFC